MRGWCSGHSIRRGADSDRDRSSPRGRSAPQPTAARIPATACGRASRPDPAVHLLDRDATHVHKQSRGFWLRWAEERFVLVDWIGLCRYLLPGGYYVHYTTHAWRRFTPAIAVVARNRP